ncbi:MAG: ABC-F family ATP-binding cassette domain-containing protein [Crocinitomicaceae bacterium]|nr:ABC-F family ATP-binding cassette domain-containing protein [Crocinitomicaceae bacterium]
MNYLSVENLTKSFGERILFSKLTFGINQGQKIAIVAKNGSGKTTLLKCLMDRESIDEGRIVYRNGIRISFMEQSDKFDAESSIYEVLLDHDLPEMKAIKKYKEAEIKKDEILLQQSYNELSELNAWDFESKLNLVLTKLDIKNPEQKIKTLSGGQKKRIALAKVILSDADLLFLDEPTNHLDLDMIEWLESYLSSSNSTILMVTHDRYFLEVVCDAIFELSNKTLFKYNGNFSYYLEKKAEREEQLKSTIEKAKNTFRKELDWIRRQPKARGTKQKARIESFEVTKKVASQKTQSKELELLVKMNRLGSKIIELHKIGKAFGDKRILDNFSYNFQRKERLGIVGNNGAGKTTFLNLILQKEEVDKGKIIIGDTIVFGYYSQELIKVSDQKRVIEVIKDIAEYIPLEKGKELSAAQLLERFLFPKEMHYQLVKKLSGGEKRRLKLLTVLMSNPNFLILDEPTNDLDIFAMAVLEDYLRAFQGCLVVVSHDRYFMDKMVDHLFVMNGNGQIKDIVGNYTVYRKEQKELSKKTKNTNIKKESTVIKEKNKLSFKEKEEFKTLETEIEVLEKEKKEITNKLSDSSFNGEELNAMGKRLSKIVDEIEIKSDRWLTLSEYN